MASDQLLLSIAAGLSSSLAGFGRKLALPDNPQR